MVPEKGAWSTLTMIDKHVHRQKRKIIFKAFSDDAIGTLEPSMAEHLQLFLDQLGEHTYTDGWSGPKDMSALCQFLVKPPFSYQHHWPPLGMRFTLDVMFDFGFGQKVGMLKDRRLDYIPRVLQNYS